MTKAKLSPSPITSKANTSTNANTNANTNAHTNSGSSPSPKFNSNSPAIMQQNASNKKGKQNDGRKKEKGQGIKEKKN